MNTGTESVQYPALCFVELILKIALSVAREHFLINVFIITNMTSFTNKKNHLQTPTMMKTAGNFHCSTYNNISCDTQIIQSST